MTAGAESVDPVEVFLEQCLEARAEDRRKELERLCGEHPGHAADLRDRYRQLQDAGLLEPVLLTPWTFRALGPSPGETFGDFRLLRELGRGGMGVVYLAEQLSMHRRVALKVVRPEILDDTHVRERFRREVEAASGLDHPGISTVYEAGDVDGTPYIAMRFVAGTTLRQRIQDAMASGFRSTSAQVNDTIELIEQVARALHYAHERGFIHRDVKPGNVMVTEEDQAVVLDFGLAGPEDSAGGSLTLTGDALGTPAYMSPEQISSRGRRPDRRTDVYSLGVTLFECLTLHVPFEAPTREELYRQILTTGQADASKHTRNLPRDLHVVLATAMARERDARYQTALDFAEDLRRVRERRPIAARRPSVVARALSWTRREPVKAALAVAVPLLFLLGGYLWARSDAIDAGQRALRDARLDEALAGGFATLRYGKVEDAVASFRAALVLNPEGQEAQAGLAMALFRSGERSEAEAVLARFGAHSPVAQHIRAWDAAIAAGGRNTARLLAELPKPQAPTGWFLLGEIAQDRLGNREWQERAQDAFLQAVASSPRARLHYHAGLVSALGDLQDEKLTLGTAHTLTTLWPDSPVAWSIAARSLVQIDPEAARRACAELARWPDEPWAAVSRAAALARLNEIEAAMAIYRKVLPRAGYHPHFWFADLLVRQDEYQEAIKVLERALEKWPGRPFLRARLALLRKDYEKAAGLYREYVAQYPDDARGYLGLARALNQSAPREAERQVRQAIALQPHDSAAHRVLGVILRRLGKLAEALPPIREALRLNPQDVLAHELAGLIQMSLDRLADAAESFWRATALRPRGVICYQLGICEHRLGRFRAAAEANRKAIALRPDYAEALVNLAIALANMWRPEEALPFLEKGHRLGTQRGNWQYDTAAHLRDLRKQIRQARALPDMLAAEARPEDLQETCRLLVYAYFRDRFRRVVSLYQHALARGLTWSWRTRFVFRWSLFSAAQTGDPEHRKVAVASLREQLGRLTEAAERERHRLDMYHELYVWLVSGELAPIRDPKALAGLPEHERQQLDELWRQVRELSAKCKPE